MWDGCGLVTHPSCWTQVLVCIRVSLSMCLNSSPGKLFISLPDILRLFEKLVCLLWWDVQDPKEILSFLVSCALIFRFGENNWHAGINIPVHLFLPGDRFISWCWSSLGRRFSYFLIKAVLAYICMCKFLLRIMPEMSYLWYIVFQ